MRNPSQLRYIECQLPDEVEKTLIAFEDAFNDSFNPYYARLADWVANDLPLIQTHLDKQIALRQQLLQGAPVQSLASLPAVELATNLTDPSRDDTDPTTVRIDERKLGAAGICLLNGVMFKIIPGNRLVALRYLWEVAGGNYDYFVRLGTVVYSSPQNSFNLFEYNPSTPQLLPYVNKGFTYLSSIGLKNSQFKHRMVWTENVSASYILKTKMAALGYTSSQINNTFAGLDPNRDYDYLGTIANITVLIQSVTRLIFLPVNDPIRQPPWENEANYIMLAIENFLTYRTNKYTTSSIFNKEFWLAFLSALRPQDIEELLVNRPEILDIELPQDQDSITAVVETAVSAPSGTTLINTYMNNLPISTKAEETLTDSLFDLGLAIWKRLVLVDPATAAQLEALLLELTGQVGPLTQLTPFINSSVLIDPADLSALFPTTNLPPLGTFIATIQARGNADLVNKSLAANSATKDFSATESKQIQNTNLTAVSGSTTNNTPSGATQGLPTSETFATLLSRRVTWSANFRDCTGTTPAGATSPPSIQSTSNVTTQTTNFTETTADWKAYQDNMAYLHERLTYLASDSITDIRDAVNSYVTAQAEAGVIAKNDARLTALQAQINSSNDVKDVAAQSVTLLKQIPTKIPVEATSAPLYSELSGSDRGAGLYAAQNRNTVEDQGGKIPPPAGSQNDKSSLETALGKSLPFLGANNNRTTEVHVCQNAAISKLDAYLNSLTGINKLEGWLIRFLNIVRQQIITFQNSIDKFILAIQKAMDAVLAKLERLLSLDLNLSGGGSFDNSLFKCSWGSQLGLKINLLELLLLYLDEFLGFILGPFLKGLSIFGDFINALMCVPIRWLEEILNGPLAALSNLLGKVGCTIKDFKLPTQIFDILNLLNGLFSLRSLVFRKGNADWLKMMSSVSKSKNAFTGLTQFANACASPNLATALSALQAASALAVSDIPLSSTTKNATVGAAA